MTESYNKKSSMYMNKTYRFSYFLKNSFAYAPLSCSYPRLWTITIERTKFSCTFYKFFIPVALGSWKENHQLMEHVLNAEGKLMNWVQDPQESKENSKGTQSCFHFVFSQPPASRIQKHRFIKMCEVDVRAIGIEI